MPVLHSRLGDWQLDHVHAWSDRSIEIEAASSPVIGQHSRVATIGSCFASELAAMMREVGMRGAMHPGGLFYSTATIRQEFERMAGGWPARADEPVWAVPGGVIDPFRDYDTVYPDAAAMDQARALADAAADAVFDGADVVIVTLGLIETWRGRTTGNTFRAIPHPAVFEELAPVFHRSTVAEMLDDLEAIRAIVEDRFHATLVITTSPVPLHTTFTPLDVRVANTESKSRIRAATSEFVERHPDVLYFHSYEMVVTAEQQSDFFREDGRHVRRDAVRYIIAEFLRRFAEPSLWLTDVDASWLTPIVKTAPTVAPQPRAAQASTPKAKAPLVRRIGRRVRRALSAG